MRKNLVLACTMMLAGTFYSAPAYAYLDPGTGSIILQLLLGGVAGGVIVFKLYWARLKSFFVRKPKDDEQRRDAEGE